MYAQIEPALKLIEDARIVSPGCGCEQVGQLTLACDRCTIKNAIEMAIASAIAAERERCAKIAEQYAADKWANDPNVVHLWMRGEREVAIQIADKIRSENR